jgi:hypothetical protein
LVCDHKFNQEAINIVINGVLSKFVACLAKERLEICNRTGVCCQDFQRTTGIGIFQRLRGQLANIGPKLSILPRLFGISPYWRTPGRESFHAATAVRHNRSQAAQGRIVMSTWNLREQTK